MALTNRPHSHWVNNIFMLLFKRTVCVAERSLPARLYGVEQPLPLLQRLPVHSCCYTPSLRIEMMGAPRQKLCPDLIQLHGPFEITFTILLTSIIGP